MPQALRTISAFVIGVFILTVAGAAIVGVLGLFLSMR